MRCRLGLDPHITPNYAGELAELDVSLPFPGKEGPYRKRRRRSKEKRRREIERGTCIPRKNVGGYDLTINAKKG